MCRSWWRSTRSTRRVRTRRRCAVSSRSTASWPRSTAATRCSSTSRPPRARVWRSCSRLSCSRRMQLWTFGRTPIRTPRASPSRRISTAGAAPWPRSSSSAARCVPVTRSLRAMPLVACAPCSTMTATRSRRLDRPCRSRCWASRRFPVPVTASWWSPRIAWPARSPRRGRRASAMPCWRAIASRGPSRTSWSRWRRERSPSSR